MASFSELGLDKWLINNVKMLQYSKPTLIQKHAIKEVLAGKNFIGISNTGTGKTASFCLPILHQLAIDPCGIHTIILEPTRELAVQVIQQLKVFSTGFNLRVKLIIGGEDITKQLCGLEDYPHIIVATPGRLAFLLKDSYSQFLGLDNLKYLVLDEFDQLLNPTIIPEIKTIIEFLPKDKQTLLFSATINQTKHTPLFFRDFFGDDSFTPEVVDLTQNEQKKTVKELTQKYSLIPEKTKELYLIHIMKSIFKKKFTIIFVSTCRTCHFLTSLLELFSFKVSAIHSKIPQKKRFESLEKFKCKINNILVATDVASRGLDIPEVDLVLNYDIPRNPDDYVHRVGRTARAGNMGLSLSFVTQYDIDLVLEIEKNIEKKLEEYQINDDEVMKSLSIVTNGIKVVQMKMFESGMFDKNETPANKAMKKNVKVRKVKKLKRDQNASANANANEEDDEGYNSISMRQEIEKNCEKEDAV